MIVKAWLLGAIVYLYLAWTFYRLGRRDRQPLQWWLSAALIVFGPFFVPFIVVWMQLGKLRHFRFRGFVDRQRDSLGLTALLDNRHPDDGGFFD